jgi:muconate cycloisomerase
MKITELELLRVVVPRRRFHKMASMAQSAGRYVIVRLLTDDGVVGLGEATVMREWGGDHGVYYGESPGTTLTVLTDDLFPAIKGRDPFDVEQILDVMDRTIKGYPYAKAAIDLALHDIIGKKSGLPVHQLLGGCYRDRIPLAQSLGIMDTDKAVAEAVDAVGEGIRTIKIKIGLDYEHDAEVVGEVRAAVGGTIAITLDANQAYPTPKAAIQQLRRLEKYNLLLIEQPVQGLDEMAQVTAALDTLIMADESAWTARDVLKIAERRAADCISIYTTKPGGLFRARQVAAVAQAAGLPCNVNGSGELGVGNAANVHLSASAQIISLACVYPATAPAEHAPTRIAGRHYVDDIVRDAFRYEAGHLIVPKTPGLGVELDPAKIAKYRVA